MLKVVLLFSFLLIIIESFSQSIADTSKTKDHYIKRSKHQKITACILLGSGAALLTTGYIIGQESIKKNGNFLNFDGLGYELLGILSVCSSIPFFLGAHKNKLKAASITLGNHKLLMQNRNTFIVAQQAAISLKIIFNPNYSGT